MLTYGFIALAILTLAQTAAIWRISVAMRATTRLNDRLSHFAEALALLTDTTEAGLASVAAELERVGTLKRSATTATRRATSKRITTAAKSGRTLEEIAAFEALSESEVRLHLQLATEGGLGASLRG